jgi:putative DNA primase/helicase
MTGADKSDADANREFDTDPEEWRKLFSDGDAGKAEAKPKGNGADSDSWNEPDKGVLRLRRRPPPEFPLAVFGDEWGKWVANAAEAAACPVDYVATPLLSSVSALIGNARWPRAWDGWPEPPHLWTVVVGDSGRGKSPGADCLMRDVLPEIERRMVGDYSDRLHEWQAASEFDKIAKKRWQDELKKAATNKMPSPPMPTLAASEFPPAKPRLLQHDVTIEQVAVILATAAPKGVVVVRDEIAGWLTGMDAYNPAGRAFWIEAYGGRHYRVERRKHGAEPIDIEHLLSQSMAARNRSGCQNSHTAPMTGCFLASNGRGQTPSHSGAERLRPMRLGQ